MKTVTEWIRTHTLYTVGMVERLSRAFYLLQTKCAIGLLQYESNRGRSPNYLGWLEQSLNKYKQTGNIDALLDVAFYAIAESDNPSFEGTFFDSGDSQKSGVEI